jgi:hypothetical protein
MAYNRITIREDNLVKIEAEKVNEKISISILNIIDGERVECSESFSKEQIQELIIKLQGLNDL